METFSDHYSSLYQTLNKYMPNANVDLIERAIRYAEDKHKDQKRKDGSPYIIHPLAVAEVVLEMGLDVDAVLGAILHDCIEDTDASFDDIAKHFGRTAAELVEGVTKLTRADFSSTEEAQMENLRKMFMAMSKDIRVVLIKIADRLHNMRTMQYQTPAKQVKKCRETMDIYAPLAHRLGMQKIKWELEDIALRYLDPTGYDQIMSHLLAHKEQDEAFMRTIQNKISARLLDMGIHNKTYGRINPPGYSILEHPEIETGPDQGSGPEMYERRYPDELYNTAPLFELVGADAVQSFFETFYQGLDADEIDQMPDLYRAVHGLGIAKEDLLCIAADTGCYTSAQIELIYTGTKEEIQQQLKSSWAFWYDGRLYNIYDLIQSEQLTDMFLYGELSTFLQDFRSEIQGKTHVSHFNEWIDLILAHKP